MFYRVVFISCFFLSFSASANIFDSLKSFEANFVQTITNTSNKSIEYKGKLYISEPSQILWQYKTPIIKNVYVLNSFAIVDEPELEQAIFTRLENDLNLLKIIKASKKIKENEYETFINNIKYKIFLENKKIAKIKYQDELENKVFIKFLNIKQNEKVDDEIFKFLPPSSYDIIRK